MNAPCALFVGRTTLDVVYALDEFPAEDTKVFARELRAAPGGPATNAAITHALLGGKAILMSAVGGGPWSNAVRAELDQRHIELIDLARDTSYETPLTAVLLNRAGSTRTIVNPPWASLTLNPHSTWNEAWGDVPPMVLTDGFHLAETMTLLAACRDAGAALCLDGGSWKPGTEDLAKILTIAICSERFAVPDRSAHAEATIAWFAEKAVPYVAVTRGPKPIVGWDNGRRFEIEVAQIDAMDTLGAGDVLHGAFCYHFARTREFEPALRLAAEIATRACQGPGIRAWNEAP
ncbi:MAG TPA: PfkB family carbohydrate kinase [Terracidiphilus sp.]|jgi:sugar/nucleoside kinase (ribokinase family)|nr:PfkB family carbohydrate kinase [Terracidiphilus sp.]